MADEYFEPGLADHLVKKLHKFDFDNVKITHKENKQKRRNILEIKNRPNAVNCRKGIASLKQPYKQLVQISSSGLPLFSPI